MVRNALSAAVAAVSTLLVAGVCNAATISGSMGTFGWGDEYDVSAGTCFQGQYYYPGGVKTQLQENEAFLIPGVTHVADWAAFGVVEGYAATSVSRKLGGQGEITLSGVASNGTTGYRSKLNFSGGDPNASGPASATVAYYRNLSVATGTADERSETLTTKLLASEEKLVVYVTTNNGSAKFDAFISGADPATMTRISGQNLHYDDWGYGTGYGRVILDVSNAHAGDILTFTASVDTPVGGSFSDPSGKWAAVGINAVTIVTAVPEPATVGLFAGVVGGLFLRRRRA